MEVYGVYLYYFKYLNLKGMKNHQRDHSVGAQMFIATQLMRRRNMQALAESGFDITLEQLSVLDILSFYGDMNMTELSHLIWKQNANITRIVDKLEKKQFVIRQSVVGDRRANLLSLTESGKLVAKEVLPTIIDINKDLKEFISKSDMTTTMKTIKKIINHLSSE